jgi:hypothetical protein
MSNKGTGIIGLRIEKTNALYAPKWNSKFYKSLVLRLEQIEARILELENKNK